MYCIVSPEDPATDDAQALIDELSAVLAGITGDSGRSSFDPNDVRGEHARFVVARDVDDRAVGCGAIRPLPEGIAELKRMYARPGTAGVGSAVLAHLEAAAKDIGYSVLRLETRQVNHRAVSFTNVTAIPASRISASTPATPRPSAWESGCSLSYTACYYL